VAAAAEGIEAVAAQVVVDPARDNTGTAREAAAVEAGVGGRGPTAAAAAVAVVDPTRGTKNSEAIDIILKYVRTWVHPNSG
jgi:hypothetical protein